MSNFDKLRGKRAELIDPSSFTASAPYTFKNGGFWKTNAGGGTVIVEFFDGSIGTITTQANELVDYIVVGKIIGGTATDVLAIHLA